MSSPDRKSTEAIKGRTISRDLNRILVFTICLVFSGGLAWEYSFMSGKEREYLDHDANIIMENLSGVLKIPVWKLDQDQIERIVERYDDFSIVQSITVTDENNLPVFEVENASPLTLKKHRNLSHSGHSTGRVEVGFTDALIRERNLNNFRSSLLTLCFVIVSLLLVSTYILRNLLRRPLITIANGLQEIGSGTYTFRLPVPPQKDLGIISGAANQLASMIDSREKDLVRKNQNLTTLNQAIIHLFSLSGPDSLLQEAGHLFLKALAAEKVTVLIGYRLRTSFEQWKILVPSPWEHWSGETPEENGSLFFPLRRNDRPVAGILVSGVREADKEQLSLCQTMNSLLEGALQRYFLLRDSSYHKAEMTLARIIQESLLPVSQDSPGLADVSWYYNPMDQTGGDWFYFYESPESSSLYIMMGDVTGHGLSSGMLATSVVSSLRSIMPLLTGRDRVEECSPVTIMEIIEDIMKRLNPDSKLRMSCITARWDRNGNCLELCNAGHTFPLLLSLGGDSRCQAVPLTRGQQTPLGVESGSRVSAGYNPAKGSTLLLYTDGLTEALSPPGVQFGRVMYRKVKDLKPESSTREMLDTLVAQFQGHTRQAVPSDDCCLLMVRMN